MHISPAFDSEIALTWQTKNTLLFFLTICLCASVFLCIPTCHFGCMNRCICLLAVGAPCAVSPNSGRCPGSSAAIVCQSGNAADGLSGPPSCGVLFFSCLILSSQILFISSSVPPSTLQSSSPVTLWEAFPSSFLLHRFAAQFTDITLKIS